RSAQIIHRFDQSNPHKISPHAIHNRAREIWILRRGEPVGEDFAAVARVVRRNRRRIERRGGLWFAGARLDQVTARFDVTGAFTIAAASVTTPAFAAHAREKIRELV